MHTVAVLLLEPIVGFDAAIPPLCFSEATDEADRPLYRVITCGIDRNPVRATGGYAITPEAGPDITVLAASRATIRAETMPPLPFITSRSCVYPRAVSLSASRST